MFAGSLTYQVTTAGTPAARNLPAVEPGTAHTGDILSRLFGGASLTYGASTYSFTYHGIPGFPGGWTQNG